MAITTSVPSPAAAETRAARPSLLHEIRTFWQLFFVAAFDPYRPEQHYMRGPGPACRAKDPSAPVPPSH
ncbi:hypothetical protein [Tardiphaga robiniae]|uniref:Uncharacterized protein n=1 Tax=Tardiphaga robiniae TaxID=943830 RepID=A0A7G6TTN6_9BRAD|nr:hypothetical protein [Tardiphaga robiniae]QND70118.1 hypothetical protein HB776_01855 [Tardiphaga robiniae]